MNNIEPKADVATLASYFLIILERFYWYEILVKLKMIYYWKGQSKIWLKRDILNNQAFDLQTGWRTLYFW